MKAHQIEACGIIANYYGKDSQTLMAIEEMSELTKEICKYSRGKTTRERLVDEIADVEIMVKQLEILFDIASDVDRRVDYKLERQLRRIEQERE